MSTDLIRLDLRLRRRMIAGTMIGGAAYLLLVIAVYPTFRHDTSLNAMVQANPSVAAAFGVTGSMTSPAGWLSANMYANFGPLLALLLTIGYGAAAIAGQDHEGLLGLVVTQPLTRTSIALQKAAALFVVALVVPVASFLVTLTGPHFELTPDWGALGSVTLAMTLLAFDLGALALLVGTVSTSRGAALGIAAGVAAAAYLISSLSSANDAIDAIRWASPFYWALGDNQLTNGVGAPAWTALVVLGVLLVAGTVVGFRLRDVQ